MWGFSLKNKSTLFFFLCIYPEMYFKKCPSKLLCMCKPVWELQCYLMEVWLPGTASVAHQMNQITSFLRPVSEAITPLKNFEDSCVKNLTMCIS